MELDACGMCCALPLPVRQPEIHIYSQIDFYRLASLFAGAELPLGNGPDRLLIKTQAEGPKQSHLARFSVSAYHGEEHDCSLQPCYLSLGGKMGINSIESLGRADVTTNFVYIGVRLLRLAQIRGE
jgi:hypothetical protein